KADDIGLSTDDRRPLDKLRVVPSEAEGRLTTFEPLLPLGEPLVAIELHEDFDIAEVFKLPDTPVDLTLRVDYERFQGIESPSPEDSPGKSSETPIPIPVGLMETYQPPPQPSDLESSRS